MKQRYRKKILLKKSHLLYWKKRFNKIRETGPKFGVIDSINISRGFYIGKSTITEAEIAQGYSWTTTIHVKK